MERPSKAGPLYAGADRAAERARRRAESSVAVDARPRRDARVRRKVRPRVAAVRGFVDPEAGLRVARGIRLAGSGIERVVRRVVGQGTDRIRGEAPGDERPACAAAGEGIVRAPDPASRGPRPHGALLVVAGGIDGERRDPARRRVGRAAERQDVRKVRRARAREAPLARRVLALLGLHVRPRLLGGRRQLERDVSGGKGAMLVILLGRGRGPFRVVRPGRGQLVFERRLEPAPGLRFFAILAPDFPADAERDEFAATRATAATARVRINVPEMRQDFMVVPPFLIGNRIAMLGLLALIRPGHGARPADRVRAGACRELTHGRSRMTRSGRT